MRIRICVGVLPNGKWAAEGSSDGDDASAEAVVRFTLNKDCTIHWVEANIPEPVVIEGEVVESYRLQPWSPRFKVGDKVQQPTEPWTYIVTKEATAPHDHFIAVESASDWEDGYPTTLEDACMQLHTGEIFDYIFPPDSTTLVTKIGEAE